MEALDVDEVVGQLLASEGFASVEELAFVERKELAVDRGLRRGHRAASCRPARRTISTQIEAELDAKRTELGVEDALKEVPGVTTAMLVELGENGVKTVEDLAGCATDDLAGWTERKDGETKREPGFLDGFELSREEAEAIDHAGPPQGRLDHRSRSRAAAPKKSSRPKRPRLRNEPGDA